MYVNTSIKRKEQQKVGKLEARNKFRKYLILSYLQQWE